MAVGVFEEWSSCGLWSGFRVVLQDLARGHENGPQVVLACMVCGHSLLGVYDGKI